jgi:polygalacturonase
VRPLKQAAPAPSAARGARTYDVRDYGAKGDGIALDTAAVQAAIDACPRDKGGTVVVPSGDFVIGTVELKTNVTLYLAAPARLLGSGNPEYYSAGKGVPPGNGDNTGPGGNSAQGYKERPHLAIFYRCRNLLVRDVFPAHGVPGFDAVYRVPARGGRGKRKHHR